MPHAALPPHLILEEADSLAATDWAGDAIFPFWTTGYEIVKTVCRIGEVNDCFFKGLWSVGFHTSIVARNHVLVKYIFALATAAHLVAALVYSASSMAPLKCAR
jgi:hypothetical protein